MERELRSREETRTVMRGVRSKLTAIEDLALPSVQRLRQSGPFESREQFVKSSLRNFRQLLLLTSLDPSYRVLDYGCGLGRLAIPMSAYLNPEGSYVGVDVDAGAIDYLTELHPLPNFEFRHVNIQSTMYNAGGVDLSPTLDQLGLGEGFDLSFLFSVFTHILPPDIEPLLGFLARTLKPGGEILASFFVLNEISLRGIDLGTSHRPFPFQIDGARIDNDEVPEGAVAYAEDDLFRHISNAGLAISHFSQGKWSGAVPDSKHWQDMLVLTRN